MNLTIVPPPLVEQLRMKHDSHDAYEGRQEGTEIVLEKTFARTFENTEQSDITEMNISSSPLATLRVS